MERLPRSASRLVLATTVLFGCSTGTGGPATRPSAGPIARAATEYECFIADTTSQTADTIFAIGADPRADDFPADESDCAAFRRQRVTGVPIVVSLRVPGADLRDLMDGGVAATGGRPPDVLVTRDSQELAYARRRGDFLVAALPWSTTYVLVPARTRTATDLTSSAARDALARDAVTSEARGATGPFLWMTDTTCVTVPPPTSTAPVPLLAFAAGDPIASELAARIRSLSAGREPISIGPLRSTLILNWMAAGRASAGLLPLARDPRTPCGTRGNARVPAGAVPLVDARAHVVIRRGSGAAILVAPDGSFRFVRRTAR